MIEVLAIIGLIVLYFIWLLSPYTMFYLFRDNKDTIIGRLVVIVFVGGVCVIGYVLVKFIGIW